MSRHGGGETAHWSRLPVGMWTQARKEGLPMREWPGDGLARHAAAEDESDAAQAAA